MGMYIYISESYSCLLIKVNVFYKTHHILNFQMMQWNWI